MGIISEERKAWWCWRDGSWEGLGGARTKYKDTSTYERLRDGVVSSHGALAFAETRLGVLEAGGLSFAMEY